MHQPKCAFTKMREEFFCVTIKDCYRFIRICKLIKWRIKVHIVYFQSWSILLFGSGSHTHITFAAAEIPLSFHFSRDWKWNERDVRAVENWNLIEPEGSINGSQLGGYRLLVLLSQNNDSIKRTSGIIGGSLSNTRSPHRYGKRSKSNLIVWTTSHDRLFVRYLFVVAPEYGLIRGSVRYLMTG